MVLSTFRDTTEKMFDQAIPNHRNAWVSDQIKNGHGPKDASTKYYLGGTATAFPPDGVGLFENRSNQHFDQQSKSGPSSFRRPGVVRAQRPAVPLLLLCLGSTLD